LESVCFRLRSSVVETALSDVRLGVLVCCSLCCVASFSLLGTVAVWGVGVCCVGIPAWSSVQFTAEQPSRVEHVSPGGIGQDRQSRSVSWTRSTDVEWPQRKEATTDVRKTAYRCLDRELIKGTT
jgi:hypothetical protein